MQYKLKYKIEDNFIENLLIKRGIKKEDLDIFLNPTEENYLDPLLLDHMDDAAQLLNKHLFTNDPIDLIVDCDIDGFSSAAIFYLYVKKLNPNKEIRYYIHEGKQHGLNDMIDILLDKNDVVFVVCPDSASNDYEEHSLLAAAGSDILILDHHEVDEGYSQKAITVNNQLSKKYPNKALSGATITYKFINYHAGTYQVESSNYAKSLIDLAAVGAIGDMMSVIDLENRYLFSKGLKNITNFGLKSLIEKQSYSLGDIEHLTPIGIAFYIVPLVNALIRVGNMREKEILFRALIEGDKLVQSTKRGATQGQKEFIAEQNARNCINAKNRQKREEDKALEYFNMIIEKDNLNDNKILFVENDRDNFNSNLTGLVAMKIMNEYNKPVILVKKGIDNTLKGSIRCNDKSALKDFRSFLLDSGLFEYVQGHASAAGLCIKASNKNKLIQYANEKLKDIDFSEGVYSVDFILGNNKEKNIELIKEISRYKELWGQGDEEPLIVAEKIPLSKNDIMIMGKTSDTIKFSYNGIEYIQFRASKLIKEIADKEFITITVLGRGGINSFMGRETPQITIIDYNIRDSILDF